jgi:hydroxymethylglutaryl-CoA lyase
VKLVDLLSETGVKTIQVISFVHPKAVPQVADAEEVARRFKRKPGIAYHAIYMNDRGLERAWNTGKFDFEGRIFLTASETFCKRNTKSTLEEEVLDRRKLIAVQMAKGIPITHGGVMAAFGCNYEGDISSEKLVHRMKVIFSLGQEYGFELKKFQLADTMGWANPEQIKRVLGETRNLWPDLNIGLHLHDTRGTGIANVYAALEMGVTDFDTAVAGLGGCPFAGHRRAAGNVCTEDIVFMCQEMGIDTGIDLNKMIECANFAEEIIGYPPPGKVMKGGSLEKFRVKGRA